MSGKVQEKKKEVSSRLPLKRIPLSVIIGKTYESPQGDIYCEWVDTIIVNAGVCQSYELLQQAKLSVYPNTASGQIVLEYPNI